jgi:hypothetical protein
MRRFFAVVTLAALLAACAGAPVQEMSDARQALRAAQAAGAADKAPAQLNEAERLLALAQENLRRHEYKQARQNAEQSRDAAVKALTASRQQNPGS